MNQLINNNQKDISEYTNLMRNLPIHQEIDDVDLSDALDEGANLNELLNEIKQMQ